ncbi:beta-ketoacyl-[acyl-carrier-protein] synthase family protein [Candidatus Riflebacteria bacterium]
MRRVFITRLGVVSPLGNDLSSFVANMRAGKSGLGLLSLFNVAGFRSTSVGQAWHVNIADCKKKWPETVNETDRKVFLGLMALEQIFNRHQGVEKPGVYLGTSLEAFLIEQLLEYCPEKFNIKTFLKNYRHGHKEPAEQALLQTPLDRLQFLMQKRYKLNGQFWTNCSACAASTQAIGQAFWMVRSGRETKMLAGGFDSLLHPLGLGGFSILGALAPASENPKKACRPFNIDRRGTVLGEGAAIFLLESEESLQSSKNEPIAELLGYGSSLDAYRVSDPHPEGKGAFLAMQRALKDAKMQPEEVDAISAHGTGTLKNDVMETKAIKSLFGELAAKIPVFSIKSMIGHLIGASGAVEITGVIGALREGFLPPTISLDRVDPQCDLDYVPNKSRPFTGRVVLKNSFGLGGQNASLIIRTNI